MRIAVICILSVFNVILESTLFQYTRINGIKPDFSIMIIVAYAILRGSSFGAFTGLGIGLMLDIMYAKVIGINALSYMVTGYIIGQAHENVFKNSFIPPLIFNLAAIIIYQHSFILLSYFSNNFPIAGGSYMNMLLRVILPQALYNAAIGAIVYRIVYKLDEAPFMDKRIY
ncbi:MAG: rod shape-determining protein MreD [Gracilibacteraceae bacterium]|nr:rod shape-determining protein MreD [Gracilibacteraceae bacterium]